MHGSQCFAKLFQVICCVSCIMVCIKGEFYAICIFCFDYANHSDDKDDCDDADLPPSPLKRQNCREFVNLQ